MDSKLVEYKKTGFWENLKRKFIGIFEHKENKKVIDVEASAKNDINKKDFFEIYEKVKSKDIEISSLDKEVVIKILKMLKEELNVNSSAIKSEMLKIDTSLTNLRIDYKEMQLAKRNS